MGKILFFCIVAYCLVVHTASPAYAGPWPQNERAALLITRTEFFEAKGRTLDNDQRRFTQIVTGIYGEYGLTNRLTLGGNIAYAEQQITNAELSEFAAGLTIGEIFAQYTLIVKDYSALSANIKYSASTKITRNRGNTATTDQRSAALEGIVAYGVNLRPDGTHFIALEGGYRNSLGLDADFARINIQYGYTPAKNWTLNFKSQTEYAVSNAARGGNDYDVSRGEISLLYTLARWGSIEVGANQIILNRNLDTGTAFFFSTWRNF